MDKTKMEQFKDGYEKGKDWGRKRERERLIKLLTDLGTIRSSMLGDNWKVIYTEDDAVDITVDRLEGNE